MDDFGVLVQPFGIRPQGKSAPMAASKAASRTHKYSSVNLDPPFSTIPTSESTHNSSSGNGSLLDDQNDAFGFGFNNSKPQNCGNYSDNVFQKPINGGGGGGLNFDKEAVFKGSMNLNTKSSDVDDNSLWGFSGNVSTTGLVDGGDLLSSDPVHDFLGSLGKTASGSSSRLDENMGSNVVSDDLIPGFGNSDSSNDRAQASSTEKNSGSSSIEELEDFGSGRIRTVEKTQASSTEKNSGLSSVEELEDFGSGRMKKMANDDLGAFKVKNEPKMTCKPIETNFIDIDIEGSFNGDSSHPENLESVSQNFFEAEAPDLDSFFGAYTQKSNPVPERKTTDRKTEEIRDLSSGTPFNTKQKISPGNLQDDFSLLFGAAPMSSQFEEIEGESEERRKARLDHFQTTQARVAQALADLNEREFRAQQEQEERHRIAEAMETEMKRWAAGKEGNLRALLSSLQQVLAPDLGWKPVTLTDLITSSQVKIAYKKAALCVHPDKVQQKGANLEQKYVAEKVFDLLKEAWNKFNVEELR